MKKFLYVASALAVLMAAAPGLAVTQINLNASGSGMFGGTLDSSGTFNEEYEFFWPASGMVAVSAINVSLGANVDFLSIVLNPGTAGEASAFGNNAMVGGTVSMVAVTGVLLEGWNSFTLTGTGTPGATYGGTVTVEAAVPEPATWGLMLLGFGLVGAGIRGRRVRGTPVTA